jgi:hypothetical protein
MPWRARVRGRQERDVMTSSIRQISMFGLALAVGLAGAASAHTSAGGPQSGPIYDTKTETTITGTVERIDTVNPPEGRGRRSMGGTHLVLKSAAETIAVHVGPTAYLEQEKVVLAVGDTVKILGSRVTIDNEPVLLVREISKGESTWTLRTAAGRPLWSGGRRQADRRIGAAAQEDPSARRR